MSEVATCLGTVGSSADYTLGGRHVGSLIRVASAVDRPARQVVRVADQVRRLTCGPEEELYLSAAKRLRLVSLFGEPARVGGKVTTKS